MGQQKGKKGVLDETDFLDPFQSGVRPDDGTKTASVALMDDLWQEREQGTAAILALLDLSAAFSDHGILWGELGLALVQLLSPRSISIGIDKELEIQPSTTHRARYSSLSCLK